MIRKHLRYSPPFLVASLLAAPAGALAAAEDLIGPPPAVSPDIADNGAGIPFPTWIIRDAIDKSVTNLLDDPTKAFHGKFSWAGGARPNECGYDCFSQPLLTQTWFRERPNERYASIGGHLKFDVEVPNWFNRQVTYYYDVDIGCSLPPGKTVPEVNLRVTVDPPIPSEPGLVEQIVNFIIPYWDISGAINDRVSQSMDAFTVTLPNPEGVNALRCRSIGAIRSGNPDSDAVKWNLPRLTALPGPEQNYTIRFDSVTRKKTGEHAPGQAPANFTVFLNGGAGAIPVAVSLPAAGGTMPLNFCRTISLKGKDALQVMIVDDVPGLDGPGAVWSEFPRAENFGAGPLRKMTTGRRAKLIQSAVQNKPSTGIVREYEIAYTIIDNQRSKFDDVTPDRPVAPPSAAEPARKPPKEDRFPGKGAAAPKPGAAAAEEAAVGPFDDIIGDRPSVLDPGSTPTPPCTRF